MRKAGRHDACLGWFLAALTAKVFSSCAVIAFESQQGAQLVGSIVAAHASCTGGRLATASLIAEKLPSSFGSQPVTCSFLPWTEVQKAQGLLVDGALTNSSQELSQLLQQALSAPSSPASLTPLVYLQAEENESVQSGISCSVPMGATDATLVLLTPAVNESTSDGLLLVVPRSKTAATSLQSLDPGLGPAAGGTKIVVRGSGLTDPTTCTFTNSTTAINVTATLLNSSVAVCTSPEWAVELGRASAGVRLAASSGGCTIAAPFEFYMAPQVTGVHPGQGPRYGSFLLQVNLGASLHDLTSIERAGIWPEIRIVGADSNGSDLILPANLTEDGCSLMTETPVDRTPLSVGNHVVHVSLNGQQFSDQVLQNSGMLSVDGPVISMSQPYYLLGAGATTVSMSAELRGMNTLPVTANLSVSQRWLSGTSTVAAPANGSMRLSVAQLEWGPWEDGPRNFTLAVDGSPGWLEQGGSLVTIDSAENADVSEPNGTSIVSRLAPARLTVGFQLVPNQVAYRGENASIPVNIENASLRSPAAVKYSLQPYGGGQQPTYIPQDMLSGYLEWDLEQGDVMFLDLPIDWSNVSFQTEDHLRVTLEAAWNAQVPAEQREVALHVFGVEEGQCPPGTFRFDASPGPPPPPAQQKSGTQLSPEEQPAGWLESILVYGGDGWSLDLSSEFSPDVPEYGVIVPADSANATLCVQPYHEPMAVTLKDSDGNVLEEVGAPVSAASIQSSAGGRRLQGSSVAVPLPGPASGSAGVHALGTRQQKNMTACNSHSWLLPLVAGQNVFTVAVGYSLSQAISAPGPATAKGAAPSLETGVYTLSVVRLADPSHAQVREINVTAASQDASVVCSNNPAAPTAGWVAAEDAEVPTCSPNRVMRLNVSSDTEWVGLHLALRFPSIQGLRVEVAGQVLSQGGNVGADQVADTTAVNTARENTDFLPIALLVGIQPGVPLEVPIVVVAEDSVTSLRYYLSIVRADIPEDEKSSSLAQLLGSGPALSPTAHVNASMPDSVLALAIDKSGVSSPPPPLIPDEIQAGWPTSPSRQPNCTMCPAGWATAEIDESHCSMCTPGSFAQSPGSPACLQCSQGTYANSWGSSHCNHCIIGTFSPRQGAELCLMCPENMTNIEDGSGACTVPVLPGTNLTMRYAVIVSFGVYLNGTTLDEIAAKVGVNASSRNILEQLIRSDTAAAFNISARDVNVTGVSQIARRVLLVNVTATLGVDLPTNSSQDAIDAEIAVKNLSADDAIDMLSSQPDKFLGRTTKALEVTAQPGNTPPTRIESHPPGMDRGDLLPWYGVLLLCFGVLLLLAIAAKVWKKRSRRIYMAVISRVCPSRSYRLEETRVGDEDGAGEGLAAGRIAGSGLTARSRTSQTPEKDPIFGGEYSDSPTAAQL